MCIFYCIPKDTDHGVKILQNIVFLLLFVIYLRGFDLLSLSKFSKMVFKKVKVHGKDKATDAYLKTWQTYMIGRFLQK